MRAPQPPTAAETFLEGLRAARLGYRCAPDVDSWIARCPACGLPDVLTVRERGTDGLHVHCSNRCEQSTVEDALVALSSEDPRDRRMRELEDRIERLLGVVRLQYDLLDRYVAAPRDEPARQAVTA